MNPEWRKAYRQRRKKEGNPIKQYPKGAEWYRDYRKTDAGKRAMKKWRMSENGIKAQEKYKASKRGQRKRHETGEEYASRIIRELEEIYHQNRQDQDRR